MTSAMTLKEAIAEESRRYLAACGMVVKNEQYAEFYQRRAHIHALALRRLRHHEVTEHESVCHRTPTVHAYGAVAA